MDQIPDQKAAIEYDPTVIKNRRLSTTTTQDITVSKKHVIIVLFCIVLLNVSEQNFRQFHASPRQGWKKVWVSFVQGLGEKKGWAHLGWGQCLNRRAWGKVWARSGQARGEPNCLCTIVDDFDFCFFTLKCNLILYFNDHFLIF